MPEIILYAAAAESGARAAMRWIQRSSARLLEEHGIVAVQVRLDDPDGPHVAIVPLHGGAVDSSEVAELTAQLRATPDDPRFDEITAEIGTGLAAAAQRYGRVLLAGAGFSRLVGGTDPAFLDGLARACAPCALRVVVAAVPQDTALEQLWCTYGFLRGRRPSEWLAEAAASCSNVARALRVKAAAPEAHVVTVPHAPPDLDGELGELFLSRLAGDEPVVVDGAVAPTPVPGPVERSPVAFPLAVANALHGHPLDTLDLRVRWRPRLTARVRADTAAIAGLETADTLAGLTLLTRWCRERFRAENELLEAHFGWGPDTFLPPPTDDEPETPEGGWSLDPIDHLWRSTLTDEQAAELTARWTRPERRRDRPLTREVASRAQLIDLGCGRGDTVAASFERFGVVGLGIERNIERVVDAQRRGLAVFQGDLREVDPSWFPSAAYVSIDNVLEHLPDLDDVRGAIRLAAGMAQRLVFIRHPSFDELDHLAELGCKPYWTDWPGEHVMPLQLTELLGLLIEAGIQRIEVRPVLRLRTTDDPNLLPLDAPPHQYRLDRRSPGVYDPRLHGPKPSQPIDRPTWYAFDIFAITGDGDPIIDYPRDPTDHTNRPRIRWRERSSGGVAAASTTTPDPQPVG